MSTHVPTPLVLLEPPAKWNLGIANLENALCKPDVPVHVTQFGVKEITNVCQFMWTAWKAVLTANLVFKEGVCPNSKQVTLVKLTHAQKDRAAIWSKTAVATHAKCSHFVKTPVWELSAHRMNSAIQRKWLASKLHATQFQPAKSHVIHSTVLLAPNVSYRKLEFYAWSLHVVHTLSAWQIKLIRPDLAGNGSTLSIIKASMIKSEMILFSVYFSMKIVLFIL